MNQEKSSLQTMLSLMIALMTIKMSIINSVKYL
jgi:hypothetical protein